jgi:hypothetical protein
MSTLKPWYQVVVPREDLRDNRPLDASEFAVHLDHIREQRAHPDYLDPARFFERTYLTQSLLDLSSQVVRRLSGIKVETSAVFNMATQFGGGKTHSETALYHLANSGSAARNWKGVESILNRAQVKDIPKAAVAVFVGTEFDVVNGRGGEGEPQRKTPWGEIAWQLGGEQTFAAVAPHDEQGIAPAGDTLRRMLPAGPTLILMDELLNYVSRARRTGLASQLYDFLHNLSEEARARDNLVLCVSIPASELEMNPEDQRDYDSYKKLLDRVGKAISMSSETEVTEIIRRRLFDWHGLPVDGKKTAAEYGAWAQDHQAEIANLGGESPGELFLACYPFHPSLISVFQRKWQSLPRFQRTRGILRLLALWVARAYQEEHRKNSREPLITLGSAPLADQTFRDALFEQLGSDQLSIPVTTDIVGKKDAHAVRLDREAIEVIKKTRLHQRVATAIFFESNGGQSQTRMEASVPEIRAAIGNPETNLADVETVLEGLTANCFYLNWDRNRYRFSLRPNLNQMLVTRRGAVKETDIEARIQQTTLDLFKLGSKGVDRRYFPTRSNDVPDRPQLTLVVLGVEHQAQETATKTFIENLVRECGAAGRTYKSGLLFVVPDHGSSLVEAARNLLAWEDIDTDEDTARQLEEAQRRSLSQSLGRAKADLKESIWRAYRHVFLLGKDNSVKSLDLGQITSSMAPSLCDLVINTLVKDDEITTAVGPNKLIRLWPPALTEWSTKAVRDAFFASPALPRLLDADSIKRTIADGVTSKLFGYASRDAAGKLQLDRFGESLREQEVEISDDLYILRAQDAERLLEPPRLEKLILQPSSIDVAPGEHVTFKVSGFDQYGQSYPVENAIWSAPDCTVSGEGSFKASDTPGLYLVTVQAEGLQVEAKVRVKPPVTTTYTTSDGEQSQAGEEHPSHYGEKKIQWSGTIPPRKWMNFYTKVISKLANSPGLTLRVSLEAPAEEGDASAKIDDIKSALRELGLGDDVNG